MSELPKKMSLQTFSIFIVFFLVKLEFSLSTKHGIVEITASNYQRLVIDGDKDAWIVAVKGAGKVSMDEWRKTELDMRGLSVRVGIIDPDTDGAFLKRKGFLQRDKKYSVARVFPYGGYKIKSAGKKDVKSRLEAETEVLESLPDETTKVSTMEELQHCVRRGYAAKPLKMPVLLLTDKSITSPVFRAIALKYSKYFNFVVLHKPSQEVLHNFQLRQTPAILVMIATQSEDKQIIRFSSVIYDPKEYGEISYLNLTRFFFSVHEKHWLDHPDAKKYKGKVGLREFFIEDVKNTLGGEFESDRPEDESKVAKEITFENQNRMCADSNRGLCLIYFVDGKDKKGVRKALKFFKDLRKMSNVRGKPVLYLWINGSCHPEYGEIFGISPHNLPMLLFAKPMQRLFKTLSGSFTKEKVSEIIWNIFLDREALSPFSRFNEILPVDCQKGAPSKRIKREENQDKNMKRKEKKTSEKKASSKAKDTKARKTTRIDEL